MDKWGQCKLFYRSHVPRGNASRDAPRRLLLKKWWYFAATKNAGVIIISGFNRYPSPTFFAFFCYAESRWERAENRRVLIVLTLRLSALPLRFSALQSYVYPSPSFFTFFVNRAAEIRRKPQNIKKKVRSCGKGYRSHVLRGNASRDALRRLLLKNGDILLPWEMQEQ